MIIEFEHNGHQIEAEVHRRFRGIKILTVFQDGAIILPDSELQHVIREMAKR